MVLLAHIVFLVQMLGISLGIGAQTVMLVAFVQAARDRVIDDTEAQFARAVRRVLRAGLVLIVLSGLASIPLDVLAANASIFSEPAYLFKWALIGLVILLSFVPVRRLVAEEVFEGIAGGMWYALFVVHILAPVTTWINLLILWAVWLIGFNIIWHVVVFSTREKGHVVVPKPLAIKPVLQKPPQKPLLPFFHTKTEPAAQVVPMPVPTPVATPVAPAIPQVPQHFQQIKIDPIPVPTTTQPQPVEQMPAKSKTDTPFLPQVPPLQPIPTIPSAPTTPIPASAAPVAPVIQAPPAPEVPPEIKLGLNVMPKSPDQLAK